MSKIEISVSEFKQAWDKGENLLILDVRTPEEYAQIHVEGAHLMPIDSLEPKEVEAWRKGREKDPIYTLCRSGGRSRRAAEILQQAGIQSVLSVKGGTLACEQAGIPVIKEG